MCNKIMKMLKIFLRKIDLFSSPQLLRYRNETNYSTLTGGTLSLMIIIIFSAILIQQSIEVITMSSINSQDFTYYVENPTYTSFAFDDQTKFILGVGITGLNLSDTQRYFDILLSTQVYSYGNMINETFYPLQQCQ
jgi:hypothetical protein